MKVSVGRFITVSLRQRGVKPPAEVTITFISLIDYKFIKYISRHTAPPHPTALKTGRNQQRPQKTYKQKNSFRALKAGTRVFETLSRGEAGEILLVP